jgi:hypothetical protein
MISGLMYLLGKTWKDTFKMHFSVFLLEIASYHLRTEGMHAITERMC